MIYRILRLTGVLFGFLLVLGAALNDFYGLAIIAGVVLLFWRVR